MKRFVLILLILWIAGIADADEQRDIMHAVVRLASPDTQLVPFEKIESLSVGLQPTGQQPITEKDLLQLAKLPALHDLRFFSPLPEIGLEQLKACKTLRRLEFSHLKLSTKQLREIGAISQLEDLVFDHCDLTEEGLLSLGGLKSLRNFNVFPFTDSTLCSIAKAQLLYATWYCQDAQGNRCVCAADVHKLYCDENFSDETLAACKFPQLRIVSLPTRATDKTLNCLAAWPELQSLTFRSSKITNDGLKVICSVRNLRHLNLLGTSITASRVAELKKLEHLLELVPPHRRLDMLQALQEAKLIPLLINREGRGRVLDLSGNGTTDASLGLLDPQLNVEIVLLEHAQLKDVGLKQLAKLKSLKEIHLNFAAIERSEFRPLAALPNLQVLKLQYAKIDDRAGDNLATLTSLRELELLYTDVTAAIVPKLLPLERLTHLRLPSEALNDANLELLAKHGRLHILGQFWYNMQPAPTDQQIQTADLGLTASTEKSLKLLEKIPVKTLITPRKLTDDGLAIIGTFEQLETLNIARQQGITDAGFRHLKGLRNLKNVTLTNTNITDAGIEHLRGLPELTRLDLENTKIGDETLRLAETLPKLKTISVHGCQVSDPALRRFAKARPDCSLGASFFVRER